MRPLSHAGRQAIDDIAQRHGFGVDATLSMLDSIIGGGGGMAQFSHPEFSGPGQWMRGGMTMISDMFDNRLKGRVDALCLELADLVARRPEWLGSGAPGGDDDFDPPSLFVPPAPGRSDDGWPAGLGRPDSTGSQNGMRYGYFAAARRLVIEVDGVATVHDTLDHRIGGFAQQQSRGGRASFTSQHGPIDVASLPVVPVDGTPAPKGPGPVGRPMPSGNIDRDRDGGRAPSGGTQEVFGAIEKLADLHARGILSDEEFTSKKAELLSRV